MADDTRVIQANRFWELGIGGLERHHLNFDAYLATIPEIPEELLKDDAEFPLLVLVEPRLGLKRLCKLAGVDFGGDDETFVAFDDQHAEFTVPTWIRVQDGRKNSNRSVVTCRRSLDAQELGLTALQGVCVYLQHPEVVSDVRKKKPRPHVMDLFGSVHHRNRQDAAFLSVRGGRPMLNWAFEVNTSSKCGSGSRRTLEPS